MVGDLSIGKGADGDVAGVVFEHSMGDRYVGDGLAHDIELKHCGRTISLDTDLDMGAFGPFDLVDDVQPALLGYILTIDLDDFVS